MKQFRLERGTIEAAPPHRTVPWGCTLRKRQQQQPIASAASASSTRTLLLQTKPNASRRPCVAGAKPSVLTQMQWIGPGSVSCARMENIKMQWSIAKQAASHSLGVLLAKGTFSMARRHSARAKHAAQAPSRLPLTTRFQRARSMPSAMRQKISMRQSHRPQLLTECASRTLSALSSSTRVWPQPPTVRGSAPPSRSVLLGNT